MDRMSKVFNKVGQLEALAYAVATVMIEAAEGETPEAQERLHSLVYLLGDQIRDMKGQIEALSADIRICDVFATVRRFREAEREGA